MNRIDTSTGSSKFYSSTPLAIGLPLLLWTLLSPVPAGGVSEAAPPTTIAERAEDTLGVLTETRLTSAGERLTRTITPATDLLEFPPAQPPTSPGSEGSRGDEYLWLDTAHSNASVAHVALSGDGSYGIAGWWLNNQRTSLYTIDDDNVPEWTRPMPGVQFEIHVDADALGAEFTGTARGDSLYLFEPSSSDPLDSHWYSPTYVGYFGRISDTGNTYMSAGADPSGPGEARVYDGAGTLRFLAPTPTVPQGIDLSADGLVAAVNTRQFVKVFDAVTGALRDSIAVPGETQIGAVLSGDGRFLATGGFSHIVRLYEWDGANYNQSWLHLIPSTTWIMALAISDDGSTIAAGTWTNADGGKVVLYDRGSSTPLWTDSVHGDAIVSLALTPDGSRVVAGGWGRNGGTVGNIVSVYDRDSATPVLGIGDDAVAGVGSCFSVDVSHDGTIVFAGGKAIHARAFGNGGWTLAIRLLDPADVAELASESRSNLEAYPNPFTQGTSIRWAHGAPANMGLRVVDADGSLVRILHPNAGSWDWDGRNEQGRAVAAGVYFVRPEGERSFGDRARIVKVK